MQDQIYNMLLQKDEVTWQTIIYELVRTEQLDPWNIDVSVLSNRYRETLKKMSEHNFFVSGKVLLASAILLRIKSQKLVDEYIAQFDNQLFPREEIFNENDDPVKDHIHYEVPHLLTKTPQPRKRQLTLKDLMTALEKALEIDERRKRRIEELTKINVEIPEKKIDISELIHTVYERIKTWFTRQPQLTFTSLVNSDKKEDKLLTFLPLLHLDSQQKIDIQQETPFGEMNITLTS